MFVIICQVSAFSNGSFSENLVESTACAFFLPLVLMVCWLWLRCRPLLLLSKPDGGLFCSSISVTAIKLNDDDYATGFRTNHLEADSHLALDNAALSFGSQVQYGCLLSSQRGHWRKLTAPIMPCSARAQGNACR